MSPWKGDRFSLEGDDEELLVTVDAERVAQTFLWRIDCGQEEERREEEGRQEGREEERGQEEGLQEEGWKEEDREEDVMRTPQGVAHPIATKYRGIVAPSGQRSLFVCADD
jgi:hypothetical protein